MVIDKHDIHNFLNRLTKEELVAILESARIGLTQQTIAEKLSLSEPDVNNLQHKIHMVLSEYP